MSSIVGQMSLTSRSYFLDCRGRGREIDAGPGQAFAVAREERFQILLGQGISDGTWTWPGVLRFHGWATSRSNFGWLPDLTMGGVPCRPFFYGVSC